MRAPVSSRPTQLLGPDRVRPGDVAVAMRSSGLHSNGYSLARHVLLTRAGLALDLHVAELGRTLGEELLEPTRIYALDCLALIRAPDVDVHAFSHVTGGGLAANLGPGRARPSVHVVVDRSTWTPHPVFGLIGRLGSVPDAELERTYNQGVGMVALVAPESVDGDAGPARAARRRGLGVRGGAAARDGEAR